MELSNAVFGSAVVAMRGNNCVAIATDTRFGTDFQTVSAEAPKVFQLTPKVFVGFAGLYSDALTLHEELKSRIYLYELSAHRQINHGAISAMLSVLLFEKRFGNYMVDSIIVSFEDQAPHLSMCDCYGYQTHYRDFVAAGTCKSQLLGMSEMFWHENMDQEELFEVISQVILNSIDRDPHSGCGIAVNMVTEDHTVVRTLRARAD